MADVAGAWDCTMQSPMGPQVSVLTIEPDGAGGFTGTNSGAAGSIDVRDGKIDGDTLKWKMDVKRPMPITLDATATVDGDTLTGTVKLGAFGSAALKGTRKQ